LPPATRRLSAATDGAALRTPEICGALRAILRHPAANHHLPIPTIAPTIRIPGLAEGLQAQEACMRKVARILAVLLALFVVVAAADNGPRRIAVLDDCDPADDAWTPTGGCVKDGGEVTFAEFLAAAPLGHPAWRNAPSYLKVFGTGNLQVANDGGRAHTFTEVAAYGNGVVPPLNPNGSAPVPECGYFSDSLLEPGASLKIERLEKGVHKYQCCFHPWMRAEVRVD
jgi:hypothetical protein